MANKTEFQNDFLVILGFTLLFIGIMASALGGLSIFMGIVGETGKPGDLSGLGLIFGPPLLGGGLLSSLVGYSLIKKHKKI